MFATSDRWGRSSFADAKALHGHCSLKKIIVHRPQQIGSPIVSGVFGDCRSFLCTLGSPGLLHAKEKPSLLPGHSVYPYMFCGLNIDRAKKGRAFDTSISEWQKGLSS